jgi:hypothetical protein
MGISIGEIYREALTELGIREEDLPKIIADIDRYYFNKLPILKIAGGSENIELIKGHLSDWEQVIVGLVKDYWRFSDYKKEIAEAYLQSKDWAEVFSKAVYLDVKECQEAFIDYVEETYQTKVKDAKHLQELTGITHVNSYYSKGKMISEGKMIEITSEPEQEERALVELEETLVSARYSKYFRALEVALQGGAKYKDLLQIKPQDYGLPKTWSGCLGSDQYSSILWALSFEFLINEPASLMLLPDLRSIAQEIEAPYSVLMDCYNLTNKGKKYGATRD